MMYKEMPTQLCFLHVPLSQGTTCSDAERFESPDDPIYQKFGAQKCLQQKIEY